MGGRLVRSRSSSTTWRRTVRPSSARTKSAHAAAPDDPGDPRPEPLGGHASAPRRDDGARPRPASRWSCAWTGPGACARCAPTAPALVDEAHDLAGQTLGRDPQLEDRGGLDQARVGELAHEHVGVRERVDRVARMPDHERRRLEGAALRPGRRGAPEEQPLQHRRRRLGVLRRPSRAASARAAARAAGRRSARLASSARHRRAEGQRDQERREGDGAAEQRVVEDRHLDQQALHALRSAATASSVALAPSDVPPSTALSTSRWSISASICRPNSGIE